MKNLVLCVMLGAMLCGCSALRAASSVSRQYNELKPKIDAALEQGAEIAGEVKDLNRAAFEKADADKSGNLSISELIAYLAALGVGAGEIARRRLRKENDELYDETKNLSVRMSALDKK